MSEDDTEKWIRQHPVSTQPYLLLVTKILFNIVADIGMKKKDRTRLITGNIDFTHSCINFHTIIFIKLQICTSVE